MRGCVVTEEKPPVVTNSNAIINTSILEKKARHRIRKRNNNLEGEPGQRCFSKWANERNRRRTNS